MIPQPVLPGVSGLPFSRRPLLSTHELAQASRITHALVDRVAFSARSTAAGVSRRIDLTGVTLERLRVFGVRHAVPTTVRSAPLRCHHIVVPLRGCMRFVRDSGVEEVRPGRAVVSHAGSRLDVRWPAGSVAMVVAVGREEFDRFGLVQPEAGRAGGELPAGFDLLAGRGRSFANVLACLVHECNAGDGSAAVSRGLEDLVLEALFELAREERVLPPAAMSTDRRRRGLLRALEYLRAHPHRQPDVSELARIACLSRRSLETAFREHLGAAPRAWLVHDRLKRARAELLAGACASIATVAARWGFTDPSRFASAYRRAFGERPSATRKAVRNAG